MYSLSKTQLLLDLYTAYGSARKGKSNKDYVKHFEAHANEELNTLCDELYERRYVPQPSTAFIVETPKKREVYAAKFRDRIVHHLYYNYTHELFERTFIADTYSCIPKRGTLYGVNRLEAKIKKCSDNYTKDAYVLTLDIKGYFMHINREKLCHTILQSLQNQRYKKVNNTTFDEILDFDLLEYLTKSIALLDVTKNCVIRGSLNDWIGLPDRKCLKKMKKGCGVPIGNLTSQLFSNIFLNLLDQFIKRVLKCKYYGRYVDDFYIVHENKQFLLECVPKIEKFLNEVMDLELQHGKIHCTHVKYGVSFLGAFIKPNRRYVSKDAIRRMKHTIENLKYCKDKIHIRSALISIKGVFTHVHSFCIWQKLIHQFFCRRRKNYIKSI